MKIAMLFLILGPAGAAPALAAKHAVGEGEHMWGLAQRYYKDSSRWRVIAEANKQIQDPHWIYPGQVLEIPDLPAPEPAAAAAVEASASFKAAPQEEAPAMEPAPEPAPAAPAAKPRKKESPATDHAGLQDSSREGLSLDMAPAMTGYYAAQPRFKISAAWRKNGDVVGKDEDLATAGEPITARFDSRLGPVKEGARFTVYRQSGARDTDADANAVYIQKIGVAEVSRRLADGGHRLIILESVDPVQPGDWLKEEKK